MNLKKYCMIILLLTSSFDSYADTIELKHKSFTLWIDCQKKSAVKFHYILEADNGFVSRIYDFQYDPEIPIECQQNSTSFYGNGYDRGHLVPANHFDFSEELMKETNYMTNILPQKKEMNRGAWFATEDISECYRDEGSLLIIGGVIWGEESNQFFLKSHGITTPTAFWKIVVKQYGNSQDQLNAWVIPNTSQSTEDQLDKFLVSPREIEWMIGENLPINESLKDIKPLYSWPIPTGCHHG